MKRERKDMSVELSMRSSSACSRSFTGAVSVARETHTHTHKQRLKGVLGLLLFAILLFIDSY